MRLKEYQGMEIFAKNGISVPKNFLITNPDQIKKAFEECTVKAQILIGSRGKLGAIKFATKNNVKEVASELLGKEFKGLKVEEVLVEERIHPLKEIYVAITVNRVEKNLTLLVSSEGGVEIEELAKKSPEKIMKLPADSLKEFDVDNKLKKVLKKMHKIMLKYDAQLVEINPLAETRKGYVALDAKIILDDNALYRHPEFKGQYTEIEEKAHKHNIQYVELDGDIAIIGNGAGLVMATLDLVSHFNGKPADFLDVGGGATVEKMEESLEISMLKKPKGIFVNIFGGITKCDIIAEGIVDYLKRHSIDIPLVVRLIGTNEAEGKKILSDNNIHCLDSMEECAMKIVELVK